MFAKNYRKRSLLKKVMAKIKTCSFFATQCISNLHNIKCRLLFNHVLEGSSSGSDALVMVEGKIRDKKHTAGR